LVINLLLPNLYTRAEHNIARVLLTTVNSVLFEERVTNNEKQIGCQNPGSQAYPGRGEAKKGEYEMPK